VPARKLNFKVANSIEDLVSVVATWRAGWAMHFRGGGFIYTLPSGALAGMLD